jgi:hypothetical protein
MSNAYGDTARANARTAIAAVDREMSRLPTSEGNDTTQELRASWAKLVEVLALGPAPETRVCPTCSSVGMRAASRCGTCWNTLEPLPKLPDPAVQEGQS